jgi:hypothetical protein
MNDKNYIMFQGITICLQIREYELNEEIDEGDPTSSSGQWNVKTDTIYYDSREQTYEYDPTAMRNIGGYCFGLHLEDDENQSFIDKIAEHLVAFGIDDGGDVHQVSAVQFHFITAEASSKMASNIEILFKQSEMSLVSTDIQINTFKLDYINWDNVVKLVVDISFIFLMLLNLYMFLNGEFNTM